MKAALFREGGRPLSLEEVPRPEPAPGEILVQVVACGICHTDLHYLDHGVPPAKTPPLILGHEPSGIVAELGKGVTRLQAGDPVLLPPVFTCGECGACRSGRENICERMQMLGNHRDGAFAEFVTAPARDAVRLTSDFPLEEISIVSDALATPYHAVKHRARVRPGERVVVYGCGGVGLNAVQCAALAGALVVAVDKDPAKVERALTLGAWAGIETGRFERPEKEIRRLTGGGADVAIEAIGRPETIRLAFDSLRKGGRLCVVGYTAEAVPIPMARVMFHEMEILGSLGSRPSDLAEVLEMVRVGKLEVAALVTDRFPLARINEGLDHLRAGKGIRSIVIL
jgi:6-hydroxycyclohex-1-ene-1-carbonyl-CoA dehydrogenase